VARLDKKSLIPDSQDAMGVFVLTDQHQLVPMKSAHFVTEDEFQSLLVDFPELLSGDTAERADERGEGARS
jgi:hypothetical protein